ncbi:MAG TPA: aminotransferase class V-fold PLP-dependent enzyme [Kouleothrix sp.]|uniref:aminotransferase class V-fold PLP-dependent enzyme n=1 Tax=Kouleothrix sp. TaxID=2779161 RepID=UPI002C368BAA|nr:aminotransferase class V-fold PLP-dependent enzyme [Kouleothrix sp.]HRC77520.1 aminotransferase class V-fold PLP-dependent enzyme [Kouleothrix sp.]
MAPLSLPRYAGEFLLRPEMAFLNHGSFGACPRPVFKEYQAWQQRLEEQPVEFLGRRIHTLLAEARAGLAAYLGTQAGNIVYVPNATYGVNIVARSLGLQPGDEVLASDHEYGAADRTWRFVCEKRGARYINQPIALPLANDAQFVDQLWAGVTPRTKVIFLSHISSPTALIFPLAEVCRRARAAGITTVIDGAHAPGQIDLALDALGADFYTGNCHKWMCAPKSAGFLFARPECQALLEPLIVSWGWRSETPGESQFLDYFEWRGTHDPAAYLSVPAAIEFMATRDWPAVRAACHALLLDAEARIVALSGAQPISHPDMFAQMRTIPLPPCDLGALKARLWDEFQIEAPQVGWNGGHYIRVSVQCYTSPNDLDRLVGALQQLLPGA